MKKVLFVDDEPRILQGLDRMMRSQRTEWEMHFTESGDNALEILSAASFDVIVTDIKMPGMDGASLLVEVQKHHPGVVRIVLSAYSETESVLRALPVSHQFLPKPCQADLLRSTVERACQLQDILEDGDLREVLGKIKALPALPRVHHKLMQEVACEDFSLDRITQIVQSDGAICARVLQVVNSSFFSAAQQITDLRQAVSYLGVNLLKDLVLSTEVFRTFEPPPVLGFSLDREQRHSLLVAQVARKLAGNSLAQDAFVIGILHDVGKLILAAELPDRMAQILAGVEETGSRFHEVERERFGITHAEVGAYLLGIWGLPLPIIEAVAHHHKPKRAGCTSFDLVGLLHVSDALVHELSEGNPESESPLDTEFTEAIGVSSKLNPWRDQVLEVIRPREDV